MNSLRVIVVGESWHGSNSAGLAWGFRELGHAVELIGCDQFIPRGGEKLPDKVTRRLLTPLYSHYFNEAILAAADKIRPHLVVVFKGSYVKPPTLEKLRSKGIWLCNFYPDVSVYGHRGLDTAIFSQFDHIFTTKTFGVADLEKSMGLRNVSFLPHGFDPLVHRRLVPRDSPVVDMVDISFIGTWSPHKEKLVAALVAKFTKETIAIWGAQWERAVSSEIYKVARYVGVTGDFYAQTIGSSKINLGLLSEQRVGSSSGDQTTSRTFEIPASGGFMLHERTAEVLQYFEEGKEVACFEGEDELIEKVAFYLANERERKNIAEAGHARCVRENRLARRAGVILQHYHQTVLV